MSTPLTLALYRSAAWALGPLARPYLQRRVEAGKEDPARLDERFGRAARPRPDGPLVWLHGASVGEARVLLALKADLEALRPDLVFLITTGTRTSAALVEAQAGANAVHQFAPLDRTAAARRFLAHWRPGLAVFAESEFWPNLILEARAAGTKLALVNARMSPATLARWLRMPASAGRLLSAFDVLLAADARTAAGLTRLAGRDARLIGNLKLAAPAPPVNAAALEALRAASAGRPVWLAASTHEGEEPILLDAHARLRAQHGDALLVIAPRHPERGEGVAGLAGGAPRRALGKLPSRSDAVYVADTIGEMGALYALAPIAFVGGSLLPTLKGHNPVEPARLDCAVLSGPFVESFADLFDALTAAGGARIAADAGMIAAAVLHAWRDPAARAEMTAAALACVSAGETARAETLAALAPLLPAPV